MIVDIHTHIFPPDFIRDRARLVAADPVFAEMYESRDARMATAEDLLDSMASARVDISVACGFWWADSTLASEHAAYMLEAAAGSRGRIVPFVPVQSSNPTGAALGVGEVRESDPECIDGAGLPLLVHCTEDVGHEYPGKRGGLSPGGIWSLLLRSPGTRVIAAHWGGGLPFYGLMPEVRRLVDGGRLVVDTAASAYLYKPSVFALGLELMGREGVCWGSDFPLRSQADDRAEVERALPDEVDRMAVLGGNALRFLGLEGRGP